MDYPGGGVKAQEGATEVPESSRVLRGNPVYPREVLPRLSVDASRWPVSPWESWLFTRPPSYCHRLC